MNHPRKRIQTVYLYPDGHAVVVWQKRDRDAGTIEWVEIHERWGPVVGFIEGRLILKPELAALVKHARAISAKEATVEAGSEKTKAANLALDTLEVLSRGAEWPVYFHNIPHMLSGPWTYQPHIDLENFEAVRENVMWSSFNVGKVHYRKRKKTGSPA